MPGIVTGSPIGLLLSLTFQLPRVPSGVIRLYIDTKKPTLNMRVDKIKPVVTIDRN